MASCITSQYGSVKSYCPQARLTVTQESSTATTVTFSWKLEYVAHGYAAYTNGVARDYTVKIDGATVKTGSYNINGITSTKPIASGTKSVSKTTSSRNVSFSVTFDIDLTWGSTHKDSVSASGSIGISAKTSYAVKYNANGGSGAPSSQTKWYGTTLKLSSTKPTRTGYIFQGWGTSSGDTSVDYAAGANYTANAAVTLYAIWKIITYTVTFNANGGTGGPTTATKSYGQTLTLPTTKPTKTNYNFLGWATSATSDVVAYAAGGSYTQNAAITLYAVWELAWIAPKITNFTVDRCTEDGTLQEDGTYALVKFNWAIDSVNSGGLTDIKIGYKLETAADYTDITAVSGGTKYSDSVSKVIGGGAIETEYNYDIRVVVTDKKGNSVSVLSLPSMFYIMDFLMGGKGVAFGKPAANKAFEVALPAVFEKSVSFEVFPLDEIFPVHTILIRYDHTSPAELYGGTWTRIAGRFLYGVNEESEIGYTGGSNTHKLTVAELPAHNHTASTGSAGAHTHGTGNTTYNRFAVANANVSGITGANISGSGYDYASIPENSTWSERTATSSAGAHTHSVSVSNTGSGSAISMFPAFMNVSIWRREA